MWTIRVSPGMSQAMLGAAVVALGVAGAASAQEAGQKTFASAHEASVALVRATESNDTQKLLSILGPDAKELVSSGDEQEDTESRQLFVKKYEEMHRLVREMDGSVTLYIGARNWPTPIPIVKNGNVWYFDTAAAKQEILARRIGRNEFSAIRICQELAAAQKEYKSTQHGEYAQKIWSDEGQRNGLYWKAEPGQAESPIGPALAQAFVNSDGKGLNGEAVPYRGYYFEMLGNGKKKGEFTFVAYPAEYRSTGVMTFTVGEDGAVYERDLGEKTDSMALAMKKVNTKKSWRKCEYDSEDKESASAAIAQ